ncbi:MULTISPECIES: lysozyme inhibitor LprI family protein [Paenibacillus]|uniref:lysozyme inhibitor LprI family protein n=1 Tax=Paenibacillus TaxID=44249 RepID=UPI002FE3C151
MKKLVILTLLTCVFLSGCGGTKNEGTAEIIPIPSGQESPPADQGSAASNSAGKGTADSAPAKSPSADKNSDSVSHTPGAAGTKDNTGPAQGKEPAEAGKKPGVQKMTQADALEMLDEIEKGLSELDQLNEEGTTASMTQAADETYKRWDTALNEIYGELKNQLTESAMKDLKEEQRKWITERDEAAAKAAEEFEGGTMEALQLAATKAEITKKRCYELAENFMK